jgi:hypothetical protein
LQATIFPASTRTTASEQALLWNVLAVSKSIAAKEVREDFISSFYTR